MLTIGGHYGLSTTELPTMSDPFNLIALALGGVFVARGVLLIVALVRP